MSVPVAFGGVSLLTATTAEAATLSNVQVSGNQRIDTATIRSYVTVSYGRNFTQADLSQTLGVLVATGFFSSVEVTSSGGTIYIRVVENPVVVSIQFDGNRRLRDTELQNVIQTEVRGPVNAVTLAGDVQRIQDRYAQQGRGGAVVTTEIQPLDNNLAVLVFHIAEGQRVKIAAINFEGNAAFTDRALRSVLQTRQSSIMTFINKADVYDPDKWAQDLDLIRRYYLQHGYADIDIVSSNVVYDPAAFAYTITVTVNEGPHYTFGQVGVDSSIDGVTADTLGNAIHIRSGREFNALDLQRSLEDIAVSLADAGYPFAAVTTRANRDYANNTIDITFRIDPGARTYIERIDIVGNSRTRDYVIRREFSMAEGDAYNRVLVDRVQRRLQSLGIFDSVLIQTSQGSSPDQVVLTVFVQEKRTGEVSATAGYSTADGIIGEVSYSESNFLGRGQQLHLSFTIGVSNRNYSISFTEPYFLGRRLPLGFDVYRRTTTANAVRPYNAASTGGQIRIGLPVTDNLTAQLAYRYAQDVVSGSTRTDVYVNGTRVTSSLSLTLAFSTIDNMSDPRQGMFARGVVEYAGLGGTERYLRETFDARWYQPIGYQSPFVAMVRFQAGHIGGVGTAVNPYDHFVLGGDTIRGFAAAGYGPRTTDGTGLALGGKTYWAATAELTFPLPFIPDDIGLRGGVFADAGMLFGVDGLPGPTTFVSDFDPAFVGWCVVAVDLADRVAALRLCVGLEQRRVRPPAGLPLQRRSPVLVQQFRWLGGVPDQGESMADIAFFPAPQPISLREIVALTGAEPSAGADLDLMISGVAPVESAGPTDICYADNPRYLDVAETTRAAACFVSKRGLARVPPGTVALLTADPHRSLALVTAKLYPAAMRPLPVVTTSGVAETATVHPTARLEEDVIVEAGAVIGIGAEIGRGSLIGPNAVIGSSVRIGRNTTIGAGATVIHSLVGDNVIIHAGAHIGQDGFGFSPSGAGHLKVPQIGRVVI